jgi:hypothetical protein
MAMLQTVMRPSMLSVADRIAGELDDVPGAAGGADLADDGQHDVLGRDAAAELAVDADQHGLGLLLQQALRGQHMLDLGGADTEGQRAEGAVGRGVAVAADDGHARLREALLRPHHMHDALALVAHVEQRDAELAAVGLQRLHLHARDRIDDAEMAIGGRHIVIRHRQVRLRPARRAPGSRSPSKACGEVTSCTSWRSMYSSVVPCSSTRTTCASQILS